MLNLISLITANSALLGSAALDFFNKQFQIGKTDYYIKMWMIIVVAAAFALLIVLSALLIAVIVKEKKEKRKQEENEQQEHAEDSTESSSENAVDNGEDINNDTETPVEENTEQSNVEENIDTESEETVADTANETEEAPQNENTDETSNENVVVAVASDTTEEDNSIETEAVAETSNEPVEDNGKDDVSADVIAVGIIEQEENNEPVSQDTDVTYNNTDETDKEAKEETMEKTVKEETNAKVVLGRLNYYLTESGYYFSLDANNGQQLFVSYSYTTQDGAMKGFETFAKAVLEGSFIVSEDKNGRFRYILNKKYQGPNYKTRAQCENAIASVKKFSQSYKVNVIESTPEIEAEFAAYLENLKKAKDIDMDEIAKEEAKTPKSGAFEIEEVDGGYRFYLYANNRQILYTSNLYASPVSAKNGIDAFKKAVYGGVVVIEKDKFANYRYILRNSTTVTYAGESYDSEASARKSFESVKRFVKSATIVPFKKKVDGEDAE